MNTQKIAITVPSDLLDIIDKTTEQRSISRSKFISLLLREKLLEERNRQLKDQYDKVFSDSALVKLFLPGRYFIEEFLRVLAFLFTVGFKPDTHPVFIALLGIHRGPYHPSF